MTEKAKPEGKSYSIYIFFFHLGYAKKLTLLKFLFIKSSYCEVSVLFRGFSTCMNNHNLHLL